MNILLNFKDKEFSKAFQKEVDVQNMEGFRLIKWFVILVVIIEYAFKIYQRIRDEGAIFLLLDFILVIAVIGGYFLGLCIQKRTRRFDYIIDLIYFLLYCYGSFYITYDLFDSTSQSRTGFEFVIMGMQSVWIQFFFFIVMKNWIFKVLLVAANIIIISLRTLTIDDYDVSGAVYLRAAVSAIYTIFLLYISEKIKRVVFMDFQQSRNKNSTFSNIIKNIPEMILMLNPDLSVAEKNNLIDKFFKAEHETLRSTTNMEQSGLKEMHTKALTENLVQEVDEKETEDSMKSRLLVMRLSALHKPTLRDQELEKAFFKFVFPENLFETVQDVDAPRPENTRVKDHNLFEILRGISKDVKGFRRFLDDNTNGEFIVIDMKFAPDLNSTQERGVEVKIAVANFSNKVSEEKIILILRDTTQRDVIARLEDNNQYKDALLASVSHELRTPLNTNINCLEQIVADGSVPSEVREAYAVPALKNGKILLNIINDILDLSQISSRSIKLYFEPHSLKQTLKNCLYLVEFQAKKKGLQIDLQIEKDVPDLICTDHVRLSRVVLNLLNNAVKFTSEGMIRVKVEAEDDSFLFSVEDTGIGLDEETITKLRNMLSKMNANERIAVRSTGAGLGLNVSNILAKMLGPEGKAGVTFDSTVNKGSKFCFRIDEKPETTMNVYVSNGVSRLQFELKGQKIRMKSKQLFEIPSAKHFSFGRTESIVLPANIKPDANDSGVNLDKDIDFGSIEKAYDAEKYDLSQKMLNSLVVLRPSSLDLNGVKRGRTKGDSIIRVEPVKDEKIALLNPQEIPKEPECTCCQVMVVDDEPFNVMTLEQLLSKWKKKCVTAFNGKDALNKLRKKEGYRCDPSNSNCKWVNLILMDKNMPIMDGIETTREISKMVESGELAKKFVVGNTAYVGQKEIDEFLGAGLQEILFKPLDKNKLEKVITKYL